MTAERMANNGSIDERLLPVVTEYLKERLIALRMQIDVQVNWSVMQSLRDTVRSDTSPFLNAVTDCVFAPHIVSDAVFATKLKQKGPRSRPVVLVSGQAHSETLKRLIDVNS